MVKKYLNIALLLILQIDFICKINNFCRKKNTRNYNKKTAIFFEE